MATICNRCSTSAGSAPKRSASSAPKASISGFVLDLGEAAVEREPHRQIGDIRFRNHHRVPMVIVGDHRRQPWR